MPEKSDKSSSQYGLAYSESIIATLREPFVVLDKNLRVQSANAAFYRNFHVSKNETEGRFIYDLGNGQWDIPQLRTLLRQVVSNIHAVEDFEVEHTFPEIGSKHMILNARAFPPESANPEMVLLAIEDDTDRRQTINAMKGSEIRYRRLFEHAKDGILILNAESGTIIDANPFMTTLLGYSHQDFLGKELWEIGLFRDIEEGRAAYRELKTKGYVRYEDLPLETTTGKKVEVEFVSNVYVEEHHEVVQCNIRDITERCHLQRQTEEQSEALADLHRRKDEFLAMLSHELRNPLAPIANAVQLLRLQKDEDPLQHTSRMIIESQVGQLTRLVDDLLEVSHITTGRIQLHQERIDMNGVLEHAVETVRPLIEQHRHTLELTMQPQQIWLYADASRLEQVVVNLLTNAVKYTNDTGIISVSFQQEGDEAVLRVRDSGIGIAPELLPRIFDLFTQAERSLDRSQGGLGIGLSLVQRLVEMHGGRVEAHSSLGQGSEFIVRLPVSQTPSLPSMPSVGDARPLGPGLKVLVVDDGRDVTHTFSILLQRDGHKVRTAFDGPTAIEVSLDFRPHVVLLDIGLPGMNGFEVARRLRQVPELENVVIVALTGYGQESDRQRSLEAGFNYHLVKPADIRKVREILATVKPN